MSITLQHKSMSAESLIAICNKDTVAGNTNNNAPFDKTAWYNPPKGLVQFKVPEIEKGVLVKFDVLEFKLTNPLHSDLINAGIWDARGMYYWNYLVNLHEAFPKQIVCHRNFEVGKKAKKDAVCEFVWNEKAIDFTRVSKRYIVMLLRLYPNEALGINDYTFAYYVDTYGKLAKAIAETNDKYVKRGDISKVNFFKWDDTGLTVEAFFTKLTSNLGGTFYGTNDVSFVPREKQLTQDECNFLESLDMCAGVPKPTDEDYASFVDYLKIQAAKHPDKYVKSGCSLSYGIAEPAKETVTIAPPKETVSVSSSSMITKNEDDDWSDTPSKNEFV